jgi:hypothetical protein
VLRKIFGSKREEATGGWKRLCNEDRHDLCSFPDITRVGRDGRGMQHACGRSTIYTGFWLENLKESDFLEDFGIDGRIILNGYQHRMGRCVSDSRGSGQTQLTYKNKGMH